MSYRVTLTRWRRRNTWSSTEGSIGNGDYLVHQEAHVRGVFPPAPVAPLAVLVRLAAAAAAAGGGDGWLCEVGGEVGGEAAHEVVVQQRRHGPGRAQQRRQHVLLHT